MKGKFPWKDMLVLGGALAAAIAGVAAIQAVSGRIDGVASMVFVLLSLIHILGGLSQGGIANGGNGTLPKFSERQLHPPQSCMG